MKKNSIHLVGVPRFFLKAVRQNIGFALKNVRRSLAYNKPIRITVFKGSPEMVIPEIGISGSAIGKSDIKVRIDFKRKFTKQRFAVELFSSIVHESSHLVREDAVGHNISLLDAMINEGVACYVENVLSPQRRIPYISAIKGEGKLLQKAQSIFLKKNFNYSEWFFGSKKLPKWVGYRLGYLIVDKFAKNNKISLPSLVRLKSSEIFSSSKIAEK